MKKVSALFLFLLILVSAMATDVNEWIIICVDNSGAAIAKMQGVSVKPHTLGVNEYPIGTTFPTNDLMYWKKSGADWVAMTPAEQAVVNSNKQVYVTTIVVNDAIYDAFLATIADAIKDNKKTYDEVKAIFQSKVDPKKADKKEKEKK